MGAFLSLNLCYTVFKGPYNNYYCEIIWVHLIQRPKKAAKGSPTKAIVEEPVVQAQDVADVENKAPNATETKTEAVAENGKAETVANGEVKASDEEKAKLEAEAEAKAKAEAEEKERLAFYAISTLNYGD